MDSRSLKFRPSQYPCSHVITIWVLRCMAHDFAVAGSYGHMIAICNLLCQFPTKKVSKEVSRECQEFLLQFFLLPAAHYPAACRLHQPSHGLLWLTCGLSQPSQAFPPWYPHAPYAVLLPHLT